MTSVLVRFGTFTFATIFMNTIGTGLFVWTICYITDARRMIILYATLAISCGCLFIMILTRLYTSIISRILYYIIAIWWAILIYLVIFLVLFHIINAIYELPMTWGLCIVLIPSVLCFSYGFYNSFLLVISELDLKIPNLKSDIHIVHISDLHLGPIYGKRHVLRIVSEIKRLNPDFVVITGDLFDGTMKISPDIIAPFNELAGEIYFSLGNHDDVFLGMEELEKSLSGSKIIFLKNEQVINKDVKIIGIGYGSECGYLLKKLAEQDLSHDNLNILLYHSPELSAEEFEKLNIHLHLGGHTHGGQMMPACDAISPFKYVKGLHKSESGMSYVYISEGVGTAGPPIRLFSRSTITLLNLHS